ncbi:hypothetical protein XVE_0189 [Xanthomonas vesicatoria ATCC 35937]|uniref:Uncharacterized protein n=1 Tax=Xanthomonas vesicatoria ATCC 35937 TaxID=925775 RepID=F0B7Z4_9XANT|nr:hypothetical protein XVE_0189 [Xanthomonas vesicatoria ATCC 35937]
MGGLQTGASTSSGTDASGAVPADPARLPLRGAGIGGFSVAADDDREGSGRKRN